MQQVREGVIVSAQVSREQREELERLAREGDRTLSQEIRRALSRYLRPAADEETQERRAGNR